MAEAAPEEKEEAKQAEAEPEEGKDEGEGDEGLDLTKEPGGDKPADVYARRRARELKQTREERDRLRENNIRMEERLRALEESKKEPEKPKVREFSEEEIEAMIAKGEVTPAKGYGYISAITTKRIIEAERRQQQEQMPLVQARTEIIEWVKDIPALSDQSSDEYAKYNREFVDLVSRGFEADDKTRNIAIRMAFGDRDSYRKKQELRTMNRNAPNTPSDGGGNGGGGGNKPSTDISRAPAELQKYWQGAGLSQKEREAHFKGYQARQAAKK